MRRPEPSDHFGPISEAELRAKVVQLAHVLGWRVFSLAIAQQRRPVKDASGYPDLTLARGRDVLWIELKREDGNLSAEQMAWMGELPRVLVIRPSDFDSLGAILR